jgi:hypothetical protein
MFFNNINAKFATLIFGYFPFKIGRLQTAKQVFAAPSEPPNTDLPGLDIQGCLSLRVRREIRLERLREEENYGG